MDNLITIRLENTNIQRFETWLDRFMRENSGTEIELAEEKFLYPFHRAKRQSLDRVSKRYEILATINKPDSIKPDTTSNSFPFSWIQIEYSEWAENRLQVQIACSDPNYSSYFDSLLVAIAHIWPEAWEDVSAYLIIDSKQNAGFDKEIENMKSGIFMFPVDFDVLVAATERCLSYFASGVIRLVDDRHIPAQRNYRLFTDGLGDGEMGKMEISKLSDGQSQIFFSGPPMVSREEWTEEEKAQLKGLDREAMQAKILEIERVKSAKVNSLQERKDNHMGLVIRGLLERLEAESIWQVESEQERMIVLDQILEVNKDAIHRIARTVAANYSIKGTKGKAINTVGGIFQIVLREYSIGKVEIRPFNELKGRVVVCAWSDSGGPFIPPNSRMDIMRSIAREILEEVEGKESVEKWENEQQNLTGNRREEAGILKETTEDQAMDSKFEWTVICGKGNQDHFVQLLIDEFGEKTSPFQFYFRILQGFPHPLNRPPQSQGVNQAFLHGIEIRKKEFSELIGNVLPRQILEKLRIRFRFQIEKDREILAFLNAVYRRLEIFGFEPNIDQPETIEESEAHGGEKPSGLNLRNLWQAIQDDYFETPEFPDEDSRVHQLNYPGDVGHFETFMERLEKIEFQGNWIAPNGVWVQFSQTFSPKNKRIKQWRVTLNMTDKPTEAEGTIMAFGELSNQTTVCFLDGYTPVVEPFKRPKIGPIFLEFARVVEEDSRRSELSNSNSSGLFDETEKPTRKISPNRGKNFRRWISIWKLTKGWVSLGADAKECLKKLQLKKTQMSYMGGWIPTEETMDKIIKAGQAGELDETS